MRVITIGRSKSDDIVIDDITVSRHHLQIIEFDDGHYRLADFGSSNGTYVNGQKVSGEIDLNWDDIVRIGNTTLLWHDFFESDIPMNKGGGTGIVSDRQTSPPQKKRNGFVTFWLILMLVNIVSVFYYLFAAEQLVWIYPNKSNVMNVIYEKSGSDFYYGSSFIMALLSAVNCAAAILLLLWKKLGFWLAVGSSAAMIILMIAFSAFGGVSARVVFTTMGALFGPVVLWAVLQIRKDGVSCWKLLE